MLFATTRMFVSEEEGVASLMIWQFG